MDNLLEKHFELQKGMYFSERDVFNSFEIFRSNIIEDFFWNYACIFEKTIGNDLVLDIEKQFEKLTRTPCIYLTGNQLSENNISLLSEKSYFEGFSEAWMVFDKDISLNIEHPVTLAQNADDYNDFRSIFVAAYGGEKTPEQPYGELPETYITSLNNSFHNKTNFYHFVLRINNQPTSIATLCFKDGVGGIYSVGTDPQFRGKGYGSLITKACISKWKELGGRLLLLQTETDSKVESLYSKLGFSRVFVGKGFAKND